MIISASRRTDIPAFYSRWMLNRLRAGFCDVPNPFNPAQVSRISLLPAEVDAIVFWTRNPRPLFASLAEMEQRGYHFYFQYTLLDNPRWLDPYSPPLPAALDTFHRLSGRIGPERVIWRYDPIVLSQATPPDFHRRTFEQIAAQLHGHTNRVVLSFMDFYPKIRKRLQALQPHSGELRRPQGGEPWFEALARDLAAIARSNGLQPVSCAEPLDLQACGIEPGKCIDDALLHDLFGLQLAAGKDPGQRSACGCVQSRDIGVYETCLFGCRYCYATGSFERARQNYARHDPAASSLLPNPFTP